MNEKTPKISLKIYIMYIYIQMSWSVRVVVVDAFSLN